MYVGETGSTWTVQRGRQTRHGDVVPSHVDRGGFYKESVAQGGGAYGAGGAQDEMTASYERHNRKLTLWRDVTIRRHENTSRKYVTKNRPRATPFRDVLSRLPFVTSFRIGAQMQQRRHETRRMVRGRPNRPCLEVIMDHSQLRAPLLRSTAALVVLVALACHEAPTPAGPGGGGGGGGTPGPIPAVGHMVIVVEENSDYSDVIGNAAMPYLNGLAQQYALATQYYAHTHPSRGNYFELATGQILTNDDGSSTIENVDNIVRELVAAGKTWKSYAEDLPSDGYTGGDVGNYARKHNVFALLSDVANDPVQSNNLVPFTQFATDLANNALPNYSFIVPNLCNDAHDCSLGTADTWLQANIDPLIKSAQFQQDGLLIILFDESDSDHTNGGGRVVWVVVSPKAKRGYQSTTFYQHQSTLRLTLKALGVTAFPNAAASAPDMDEFFMP